MNTRIHETSNKIWNAGAKLTHNELDEILGSFAREIHNETLDACKESLKQRLNWQHHAKAYLDGENQLSKENKSGWNSAIQHMHDEALTAIESLKSTAAPAQEKKRRGVDVNVHETGKCWCNVGVKVPVWSDKATPFKEVLERFDERLDDLTYAVQMELGGNQSYEWCQREATERFFTQALTHQQEEIIGIIEGMRLDESKSIHENGQDTGDMVRMYNRSLDDLSARIKGL